MPDRSEQSTSELRGSLLTQARLKESRDPDGWVSAMLLATAARDRNREPADAEEAARLLDELVELGLLTEKASQEKGIGQRDLRHRFFRITQKCRELFWGRI